MSSSSWVKKIITFSVASICSPLWSNKLVWDIGSDRSLVCQNLEVATFSRGPSVATALLFFPFEGLIQQGRIRSASALFLNSEGSFFNRSAELGDLIEKTLCCSSEFIGFLSLKSLAPAVLHFSVPIGMIVQSSLQSSSVGMVCMM